MSVRIVNTSKKKRKTKTDQWTNKGLTIRELVENGKEGDKLKLVADYTFGLHYEKFKTHTLKDEYYLFKKGSTEYNPGVCSLTITTMDGVVYCMFSNDDQIIGLEIEK